MLIIFSVVQCFVVRRWDVIILNALTRLDIWLQMYARMNPTYTNLEKEENMHHMIVYKRTTQIDKR